MIQLTGHDVTKVSWFKAVSQSAASIFGKHIYLILSWYSFKLRLIFHVVVSTKSAGPSYCFGCSLRLTL